MSYEVEKAKIDMQNCDFHANSAKALQNNSIKNQDLAQRIAFEQEQEKMMYLNIQNKQIEILQNNLKQSEANYKKLNDLYDLKCKELDENKKELKQSKKYNKKMLMIALISVGIAVLSFVATIILKFI